MNDGVPFQRHSEASRAGAEAIAPYVKTARYRVYRYICEHPGVCDLDIQQGLKMNKNTERPRRVELEYAGLIQPCGEDPRATGRVLFHATAKPYPESPPKGFWVSRMRRNRAVRPTPEELEITVRTMRKAQTLMHPNFPPEAVRVLLWLDNQC
jgi:hypothetical protein